MKKILLLLFAAGMLWGCGKQAPVPETIPPTTAVQIQETQPQETRAEKIGFSYEEIADREFWFGSGAGGWATVLSIGADGSFQGSYHDSEMGEMAPEYPNGTYYRCVFSGQLSPLEKVSENTFSASVIRITLEQEPGTEDVRDGIRYVSSEPFGMDNAGEVLFYLPGTPVAELPEGFRYWIAFTMDPEETQLPFYGLYNPGGDSGFSSYQIKNPA